MHPVSAGPYPGLMTEIMTGRATELTRLSQEHAAHNYHPLPVVIDEADGAWVTDVDGRRYLDLLAAYSALNFGHRHPRLIAAAMSQLGRLTLVSRASSRARSGSRTGSPPRHRRRTRPPRTAGWPARPDHGRRTKPPLGCWFTQ